MKISDTPRDNRHTQQQHELYIVQVRTDTSPQHTFHILPPDHLLPVEPFREYFPFEFQLFEFHNS